jgi:hypothetical protein
MNPMGAASCLRFFQSSVRVISDVVGSRRLPHDLLSFDVIR